ncbi:MAG TPA: hypothetical protein VNF29_02890 [Candidatus Binataceae bacterium]|nr:hypothetical protein [Candidatus Binataceae bacterium]
MSGADKRQRAMLVVINPEQRAPQGHPPRRIKAKAFAALKELSPVFDRMYSAVGRQTSSSARWWRRRAGLTCSATNTSR